MLQGVTFHGDTLTTWCVCILRCRRKRDSPSNLVVGGFCTFSARRTAPGTGKSRLFRLTDSQSCADRALATCSPARPRRERSLVVREIINGANMLSWLHRRKPKSVVAIIAHIFVAGHRKTSEDPHDGRQSPRTESLIASAVQWAERIMQRIEGGIWLIAYGQSCAGSDREGTIASRKREVPA